MKKSLILLLVAGMFALTSCSDDDDDADTSNNSIVGTWEVTAIESIAPVDPNDQCENDTSTITFEENNTVESTFYFEANDCVADTATGTWENLGNGDYIMGLGSLGELEGDVEFINSNKFTFSTVIELEGIEIPATFTLEKQ